MKWSKEQIEKHQNNFDMFKEKYIKGENGRSSIENIWEDKRRCITLIHLLQSENIIELPKIIRELNGGIPGFYYQEIPHFTIDYHRYLTADKLSSGINNIPLDEQRKRVIIDEELSIYGKILKEQIQKETPYKIELRGIAIGGDGLIAQVWYDNKRLQEFNGRLGEKVRQEIPTMDFQWGIVKNKVPIRVLNLTRFTGEEDKNKVVDYVDKNRNREIAQLSMDISDLVLSDHYIQKKNTLELGKYSFRQ